METASKFRKRKRNSSSCVYVLHKTSHKEISHPSRAVTAKKCTKSVMDVQNCCFGCYAHCFFDVLLPSPSSLLKLPIITEWTTNETLLSICIVGDHLTSTLNDLANRIWQTCDKEGALKRATKTWLWVKCCFFVRLWYNHS